jgi:hypothetical protein
MVEAPKSRSGFAVTVLAGLITSALTAVVSARAWFHTSRGGALTAGIPDDDLKADMPLALALALVVLASWGVVLVVRGRARRVVLGVGLLAGLGVVACAATAPFVLPDQIRDRLLDTSHRPVDPTAAYLVACVAAVASVVALTVGWLRAPAWPTMSSRYDAPAARDEVAGETDLWKALDEGHDPTDPSDRDRPASP